MKNRWKPVRSKVSIRDDVARYSKLIRDAGIKGE